MTKTIVSLVLMAVVALTSVECRNGVKHEHVALAESATKLQQSNWNVQGTVNLVKQFEGLSLTAYICPAGVLTIGYGHTGADVYSGMRITTAQAESYLAKDLQKFEYNPFCLFANTVNAAVLVPLNANQRGALISFTYNVGGGNFRSSTLLKRLNAGENPNTVASQEMPRWNKGGGVVLPGLVRRRTAEVAFFKS